MKLSCLLQLLETKTAGEEVENLVSLRQSWWTVVFVSSLIESSDAFCYYTTTTTQFGHVVSLVSACFLLQNCIMYNKNLAEKPLCSIIGFPKTIETFNTLSFCTWVLSLKLNILYLSASRAQQVPAVSQSAYSPSSSDTGESMLANSPQTVLTKSLPPANIMGLPPTQPTTKVHTKNIIVCKNTERYILYKAELTYLNIWLKEKLQNILYNQKIIFRRRDWNKTLIFWS